MHDGRKRFYVFVLIAFLQSAAALRADSSHCAICGGDFGDTIYTFTDKVTHEKVQACYTCATWPNNCFICGLPARKDFVELRDGRFICARDAKTAVLDENEAKQLCRQVRDELDRTFSRFMTFPETNVDIGVLDRIDLMAFKVPGNDFECPDLLGYIRPETNDEDQVEFQIRIMSALPRAEFRATCAHEYSHAWVYDNVPAARRKKLGRDAHEGFCELISFLLMDAQQEEAEKKAIRQNGYTRGQVDLFIEAEQRYGLDEILDWMKYGVDAKLDSAHLDRVRDVVMPKTTKATTAMPVYATEVQPAPDKLVLRGISSGQKGALAFINDQTLAVGESARIRVGKTNVMVRCISIGKDSVRIRIESSGAEQELRMEVVH